MGNKSLDETGARPPLRVVACSGWTGLGNESLTCTVFWTQGSADTGAMTPLRGVPGGASETKLRCLRYAVWQDQAGRA